MKEDHSLGRRSFIAGILATGIAPALVRSGMLMPVKTIAMPSSIIFYGQPRWMNDAAFLESYKWTQTEIARVFQVPQEFTRRGSEQRFIQELDA